MGKGFRVKDLKGPRCLRCGKPTSVWHHHEVTQKMKRQPFYYRYWYRCDNEACKTTQIMPLDGRVMNQREPSPVMRPRPLNLVNVPLGNRRTRWLRRS